MSEQDDILTTEEAAKLLKVSERTLERWRVRRRIPYVEYPKQGTSGTRPFSTDGPPRVAEATRRETDS